MFVSGRVAADSALSTFSIFYILYDKIHHVWSIGAFMPDTAEH